MNYEGFTTFKAEQNEGVLTVTFDYPPVNVQGAPMLADLNTLAMKLERDRATKVVVFQWPWGTGAQQRAPLGARP